MDTDVYTESAEAAELYPVVEKFFALLDQSDLANIRVKLKNFMQKEFTTSKEREEFADEFEKIIDEITDGFNLYEWFVDLTTTIADKQDCEDLAGGLYRTILEDTKLKSYSNGQIYYFHSNNRDIYNTECCRDTFYLEIYELSIYERVLTKEGKELEVIIGAELMPDERKWSWISF
jgi:hypothetical protein